MSKRGWNISELTAIVANQYTLCNALVDQNQPIALGGLVMTPTDASMLRWLTKLSELQLNVTAERQQRAAAAPFVHAP